MDVLQITIAVLCFFGGAAFISEGFGLRGYDNFGAVLMVLLGIVFMEVAYYISPFFVSISYGG